ncbi:MAG: arsenosugar biosynthesis radical SAM (seleno)protein ArsS [Thiolinea sp.]
MRPNEFALRLQQENLNLKRNAITTLQVNIGKLCNQACHHCHVEAGPKHPDNMELPTVERLLDLLRDAPEVGLVDVTGGAPEMNPHFRYFVSEIRKMGRDVIDRCNLTVLYEPGQEDTAEFLAEQGVKIVASLPCYTQENVEEQRGRFVFDKSIQGLRLLNSLGYGQEGSGLELNLVYNPNGHFLPPGQADLLKDYKVRLREDFGIEFNQLFTITNMPIKRYLHSLEREGELENYMQLLLDNFNVSAAMGVMCTNLVSVGFDGSIYDCDFNQMLEMPVSGKARNVMDIGHLSEITDKIVIANHCFGCTAGAGSSCGGSLV